MGALDAQRLTGIAQRIGGTFALLQRFMQMITYEGAGNITGIRSAHAINDDSNPGLGVEIVGIFIQQAFSARMGDLADFKHGGNGRWT